MDMGKQLNLVHIQQSGAFVQFFNKIDGSVIAVIELSSKANYTENTTYIFSVAEAVEDFIEELVDRSIAVNTAHRVLTEVTIVNVTSVNKTIHLVKGGRIMARINQYHRNDAANNMSLELKIGAAVEDYVKAITRRLKTKSNTKYQTGRNPVKKDYGAFKPRQG
jgi:predicted DNA-binding protein